MQRFAVVMGWSDVVNSLFFRLSLVCSFSLWFFGDIKAHSFVIGFLSGPSATIWFLVHVLSMVLVERSVWNMAGKLFEKI